MTFIPTTAVYCELTLQQGADWYLNLKLKNNDGSPRDLTGYDVLAQIRQSVQGGVEIELTSTGGTPNIVITPATGLIACHLGFATTSALKFLEGVYDLWLIYTVPAPDVKTCLLYGLAHVRQAVTR